MLWRGLVWYFAPPGFASPMHATEELFTHQTLVDEAPVPFLGEQVQYDTVASAVGWLGRSRLLPGIVQAYTALIASSAAFVAIIAARYGRIL